MTPPGVTLSASPVACSALRSSKLTDGRIFMTKFIGAMRLLLGRGTSSMAASLLGVAVLIPAGVWADAPATSIAAGNEVRLASKAAAGNPDDAHWSDEYTLGIGCNGPVHAFVRLANGNYVVGGAFSSCGDVLARNIAQFDPVSRQWSAMRDATLGNGFNSEIRAMVVDGDTLYVASGYYVHRWDGASWAGLDSDFNGDIEALAIHEGALIAGGDFSFLDEATGYTIDSVARLNGTSWEPLGDLSGSLFERVLALTVFNGELIAGGYFNRGDETSNVLARIARWNGTTWLPLGSDGGNGVRNVAGSAPYVAELAVWQGALYVAGRFVAANADSPTAEVPAANIARWDGSNWSSLGTGLTGGVGRALVGIGNDLYVGGTFASAGGTQAARLARWDGAAWHALSPAPAGAPSSVFALGVGASGLLVGGEFGVVTSTPTPDRSARVVNHVAELVAGELQPLGANAGSGANGQVLAMTRFLGDLYIGGTFTSVGGVAANNIARWDGEQWHAVGDGIGNGADNAVYALEVAGDELIAGGLFVTVDVGGAPKTANGIARWDGKTWRTLEVTGIAGVQGRVHTLLWSAPTLYVGGAFRVQDTQDASTRAWNIARWDGAAWSSMGTGAEFTGITGAVHAMALMGEELYVGGRFYAATFDGVTSSDLACIARWDGSQWQPVGSGDGRGVGMAFGPGLGEVLTFAVDGNDLYVGGDFDRANAYTASMLPVSNIARWDGQQWHAMGGVNGSGPGFHVHDLEIVEDRLFVAGSFLSVHTGDGPLPANRVTVWDGAAWSPLGSGVVGRSGLGNDAAVNVLLPHDGESLLMGGQFGVAGGKVSSNLAHFAPEPEGIFSSGFESLSP
jgi:trimeric autotransporter adhesin